MKNILRSTLFAVLMVLLTLAGCKEKEEKVSKEEATKFARDMEKQVSDYKIDFIEKNIHIPILMERINKDVKSKQVKGLEQGIKNGLKSNNYERSIYEIMGGKGSFELTKQYEEDGMQHIIFRTFGVNGLNYLDMELTKHKGKTGIADMFLHSTGENLSKSMGDLATKLLQHEGSSIESVLIERFKNIERYNQDKQYEKAKAEFLLLPYDLRNDRLYEARYLEILSHISEEEYRQEMDKMMKKYEERSGFDLMLLDIYLSKKDYSKALTAIDAIDSTVKKDPFLDYYRGLINNLMKDTEKALGYFKKGTVSMPDFAGNYAELFAHYTTVDDKNNAKKYYSIYKKLKGNDPEIVSSYATMYPWLAD